MFATVIVILVIILSILQFYLKSSVMTSFVTLVSAVLGLVIAFGYYEPLADQLISRGYGGQWAQPGCFTLLFVIGLAAIRSLADFLAVSNINFGTTAKSITAVLCGAITGVIIAGAFLVALGLSPLEEKYSYKRFSGPISSGTIQNPNKPLLNADGLVTGLFNWVSKGSLSSGKSFAVYHSDFLNQIHLNQIKTKDKVLALCAKEALILPEKNKKPIRLMDINDKKLTVVRIGISSRDIADGGARAPKGDVSFTLAQIRLICKEKQQANNSSGTAKSIYPIGEVGFDSITQKRVFQKTALDEIIKCSNTDFDKKRIAWRDIAFDVPSGLTPILIQFKQNAVQPLPATVTSTEEIENILNGQEPTSASENEGG